MIRKTARRQIDRSSPQWILTYADMATLLLTFFIFLFSASELSEAKFQAASGSLKSNMGLRPRRGSVVEPRTPAQVSRRQRRADLVWGAPGVEAEGTDVLASAQGTRVMLGGSVRFSTSSAELDDEAKGALRRIADEVRGLPNIVEIHGHVQKGELERADAMADLSLSLERATTVLRFLVEDGGIKARRLRATGAGSEQPAGAGLYDPERNRRVEVIVVREAILPPGEAFGKSRF